MPTTLARIGGRTQPAPWESVFRDHAAAVYAYAQRLTGCRDDAAELTRETFVRALPVLERSELPADRVESELFATCRQTYFRTSASGSRFTEAAEEVTDATGATLVVKDTKTAPVESEGLTPRQRESLALREVESKRYREIGEILGMPAKAVAQLIFLARVTVSPSLKRLTDGGWQPTPNCPQDLHELSAFVDWELHEPAASKTAGHVAGCPVCTDAVAVIRSAADAAPAAPVRADVLRRVRGGVAAALTGTGLVAAPPRAVAGRRFLGARSLAFGSSLAAVACAFAVVAVISTNETPAPIAEAPPVEPSVVPTAPPASPAPSVDPLPEPDPRPDTAASTEAPGSAGTEPSGQGTSRSGTGTRSAPQVTPRPSPAPPVAQPQPTPRPAPPVETDPPPAPTPPTPPAPTPPTSAPPAPPPAAPPPATPVSAPKPTTPTVSARTRDDELDLAASPPHAKRPVQVHPEVGIATTASPPAP